MHFSIIVPMLNESGNLPALIAQGHALRQAGAQVVLVDGGSSDNTVALAKAAGLSVVTASRGRAAQMNAGAAQASGDVLVFLHADTRLPADALPSIAQALATRGSIWGRFDVRLIGQSAMLPVVAWFMNWRSRLSGIATGDQAMFVRRVTFENLGGFANIPLMEDIELSKRLRRVSRPRCLSNPVHTSGRRWDTRGAWRTIMLMWRIRWAYWRGAAPSELARLYR